MLDKQGTVSGWGRDADVELGDDADADADADAEGC